jgi:aldose 1-epimerase
MQVPPRAGRRPPARRWTDIHRSVIGSGEIEGFPVLTIGSEADGGLEAAFAPGVGMVGCSLRHRGEELLGQRHGLRGYATDRSTMGIPLLYPWANRLAGARFELAGRSVDVTAAEPPPKRDGNGLPIHGLLSAAPGWSVERHEATADGGGTLAATFDLAAGGPLVAGFPFPHRLGLEATVSGPALTVRTTVSASAGSPIPIAFGFHPYLALPGVARGAWRLKAPVTTRLELDEHGLPNGERTPVELPDGRLGESIYDDLFLAPPAGAAFELAGGGRRIRISFGPGYRFAQIYAPAGDALIAIEPMTAPTNALISAGPDLPIIEAGTSFEAEFTITVEDE